MLLERARALLADPAQGELDLGVEPPPPVDAVVLARPRRPALFDGAAAGRAGGRGGAGAGAGHGRRRVLYDALAGVYADLGFDALGDEVFRDLVIARVVEPTSLLDSAGCWPIWAGTPASYATMKRTLAPRPRTGGYRDQIAAACFEHAATSGDVSLVLYDVTTLYFEAEKEDDLRKVGYSKERRVDPQIVVGLLVDRGGFPLEIGCFEGNKAETATIVPIVKAFQARHGIADMVVVADAGMLSASNLRELDEAGLRFIVGSRVTKAPIDLASHFRWHGDAFTDGQVIDTITPRHAGRSTENDPAAAGRTGLGPRRASRVVAGGVGLLRQARRPGQQDPDRCRRTGPGPSSPGRRPPAPRGSSRPATAPRTLDEASLARARRLVGLKGYVTNIPAERDARRRGHRSLPRPVARRASFRMSKTDLRARPMFHHTRDAIEAHLTIVFTALAVSREVQNRTGLSIRNVIRQLRPLRSATIAINGAIQTFPPALSTRRAKPSSTPCNHPNSRH